MIRQQIAENGLCNGLNGLEILSSAKQKQWTSLEDHG